MALVLPRSPGAGDAGKLKGSRSERVEKAVVHNVCPGGAANSVRITSHLGYGLGCVCVPCLDIFVSVCLCISHKTKAIPAKRSPFFHSYPIQYIRKSLQVLYMK